MILFCINPYLSHFIPTLTVVRALEKTGIEVTYIGCESSREWVEKENFKFIPLLEYHAEDIKKLKKEHSYDNLERCYYDLHNEIMKIIKSLANVTLVLFHVSRFDIFFLPAYKSDVKAISYSTSSGSIHFNGCIPPNTSSFIPMYRWDIRCLYLWVRRYIRKAHDSGWIQLKNRYPYNELHLIANEQKYKWEFCIDGFYLKTPHFKLGPRELEFKYFDEYYYASLCVTQKKVNTDVCLNFKEQKPTIYCTLGTMSYRYLKTKKFMNTLIEILKRHQEWNLIVSMGCKNVSMDFGILPSNIKVYDFVDQQHVLDFADLTITHGGYGTIKECIYYEVPMIVCPSSYDQQGNAARVFYHRLGLRNSFLKKTMFERIMKKDISNIKGILLEKQIFKILNNSIYKKNIHEIKEKITLNNDLAELVKFLETSACNNYER